MISGGKMQKQEIQICEYNSPFSKKNPKNPNKAMHPLKIKNYV